MVEPWAHGSRVRATAYATWWDVNTVRVEGPVPAELTVAGLAGEADTHLAGLAHRKVELEDEPTGARLATGLRELGWHVERLVWMWRDGQAPGDAGGDLAELPAPATTDLRTEWLLDEKVMRTGLLRAAIGRARESGVRDLWILADAGGRPRRLYERLGFRAAWTHWDCVRRPG